MALVCLNPSCVQDSTLSPQKKWILNPDDDDDDDDDDDGDHDDDDDDPRPDTTYEHGITVCKGQMVGLVSRCEAAGMLRCCLGV